MKQDAFESVTLATMPLSLNLPKTKHQLSVDDHGANLLCLLQSETQALMVGCSSLDDGLQLAGWWVAARGTIGWESDPRLGE